MSATVESALHEYVIEPEDMHRVLRALTADGKRQYEIRDLDESRAVEALMTRLSRENLKYAKADGSYWRLLGRLEQQIDQGLIQARETNTEDIQHDR